MHRCIGGEHHKGAKGALKLQLATYFAGEQNHIIGVSLVGGEDDGTLDAAGHVLDEEIELGTYSVCWPEAEENFLPLCVEHVRRQRNLPSRGNDGRHRFDEEQTFEVIHGNRLGSGSRRLLGKDGEKQKKFRKS